MSESCMGNLQGIITENILHVTVRVDVSQLFVKALRTLKNDKSYVQQNSQEKTIRD